MADVRAIDANALKNAIRAESWKEDITVKMAVEYINILIDEQPTINPDDHRPRGRWRGWHGETMVAEDTWKSYRYFQCSECDRKTAVQTNYCPNCGAKMDGKENNV